MEVLACGGKLTCCSGCGGAGVVDGPDVAILIHNAGDAVVVELPNCSFEALGTRGGAGEGTLGAGGDCQARLSQMPCHPLAWPVQHILHDTTSQSDYISSSSQQG